MGPTQGQQQSEHNSNDGADVRIAGDRSPSACGSRDAANEVADYATSDYADCYLHNRLRDA